jgi:hypothetical protein
MDCSVVFGRYSGEYSGSTVGLYSGEGGTSPADFLALSFSFFIFLVGDDTDDSDSEVLEDFFRFLDFFLDFFLFIEPFW